MLCLRDSAGDQDGVTSCNRRMRAVQSGGRELASGARSHARTCTERHVQRPGYDNKVRRSSDYTTHTEGE